MIKKSMFAMMAGALVLTGCGEEPTAQERTSNRINDEDVVVFTQHTKTGLCFAARYIGYDSGVMTHVPCTPEVMALIGDSATPPVIQPEVIQ